MNKYVSTMGCYVNKIEDFESAMECDVYQALKEIHDNEIAELQPKSIEENYELIADEYFQQLNEANMYCGKIVEYIQDTKRINRDKLTSMILELKNILENY